jgi:hypothetical protein
MCDAIKIERSWYGKLCKMFLNIGQLKLDIRTTRLLVLLLYCTSILSFVCLKRLSVTLKWVQGYHKASWDPYTNVE